jgi:hypothetical protein
MISNVVNWRMKFCLMCLALGAAPASAQKIIAQIPISTGSCCSLAVNAAQNLIYVGGGFSASQAVTAVDGNSFSITSNVPGSGPAVDAKNDNYWAAGVYSGSVYVYSGSTNSQIETVTTGDCPGDEAFDCNARRMWTGAQCGGGNDPVFAVSADTFGIIAGPIGSGGVMGPIIANPNSGALFMFISGTSSERVDGTTFAVTTTSFGQVVAVNSVLNRLYAVSGNDLQIVNGETNPETVIKTIKLPYTPAGTGAVNNALDHLYLANPTEDSVDIRNDATGAEITTVDVGPGIQALAADSTRGRIYAAVSNNGTNELIVIDDSSTARICMSRGSCN